MGPVRKWWMSVAVLATVVVVEGCDKCVDPPDCDGAFFGAFFGDAFYRVPLNLEDTKCCAQRKVWDRLTEVNLTPFCFQPPKCTSYTFDALYASNVSLTKQGLLNELIKDVKIEVRDDPGLFYVNRSCLAKASEQPRCPFYCGRRDFWLPRLRPDGSCVGLVDPWDFAVDVVVKGPICRTNLSSGDRDQLRLLSWLRANFSNRYDFAPTCINRRLSRLYFRTNKDLSLKDLQKNLTDWARNAVPLTILNRSIESRSWDEKRDCTQGGGRHWSGSCRQFCSSSAAGQICDKPDLSLRSYDLSLELSGRYCDGDLSNLNDSAMQLSILERIFARHPIRLLCLLPTPKPTELTATLKTRLMHKDGRVLRSSELRGLVTLFLSLDDAHNTSLSLRRLSLVPTDTHHLVVTTHQPSSALLPTPILPLLLIYAFL